MTQTPAFKLYLWIVFFQQFFWFLMCFSSCGTSIKYIETVPHNPRFYFFLEQLSVTISYKKLLLPRLIHALQVKNMIKPLFFDIQTLPPYFGTVQSWKYIPWIKLLWKKKRFYHTQLYMSSYRRCSHGSMDLLQLGNAAGHSGLTR